MYVSCVSSLWLTCLSCNACRGPPAFGADIPRIGPHQPKPSSCARRDFLPGLCRGGALPGTANVSRSSFMPSRGASRRVNHGRAIDHKTRVPQRQAVDNRVVTFRAHHDPCIVVSVLLSRTFSFPSQELCYGPYDSSDDRRIAPHQSASSGLRWISPVTLARVQSSAPSGRRRPKRCPLCLPARSAVAGVTSCASRRHPVAS